MASNDTQLAPPRLVQEFPVDRGKERRLWPEWTTTLYLFERPASSRGSKSARWSAFASWISQMVGSPGQCPYAYPINCLLRDSELEGSLGHLEPIKLQSFHWLFRCSSPGAVRELLAVSSFEQVVFYSADSSNLAREIATTAGIEARFEDGRYDTPFLSFCDRTGGFVFYSYTHDNLEVIGCPEFILGRCFAPFAERLRAVKSGI